MRKRLERCSVWVIDLDGVIWLGDTPIPGASEAVRSLQDDGRTVVFATNNSSRIVEENEAKLARHSIDATGAVISSALAAGELVDPDETVLVCGGPGVVEAVSLRGATIVERGPADAVVVGWTPDFDFDMLTRACQAVHGGARLIGTNSDAALPSETALLPGCGALVAAVEAGTGVQAEYAGKPHPPLARYIHENYGRSGVVVGDRPETDGIFANTLGFDFALVLSGVVSSDDLPVEPAPDFIAADLATLVQELELAT